MTRTLTRHLLVYLFYLSVAIILTWPLAAQLATHLVGFDYGDSHEMARHIWWYNHALRTGQPIFYQTTLGYPDGMDGVLLWAHPQQFFPAWLLAFVLPLPAAANVSILLYMALNGWAMYVLLRYLLRGAVMPALVGGLAFLAAPTIQAHLAGGHAGLMVQWGLPLYVYALLRLRAHVCATPSPDTRPPLNLPRQRGRLQPFGWTRSLHLLAGEGVMRWLLVAALFFVISAGGHILQVIYALFPITGVFLLVQLWRREWRGLAWTLGAAALGSAALMIFLLPIIRSTLNTPAYVDEGGFVRYSADLLGILTPSFLRPLTAALEYPRRVLGVNIEEGTIYAGVVVLLLAALAVWRRPESRWWLLLALVSWLFALGPLLKIFDEPLRIVVDRYGAYITLPWAALQNLPLFSLARTPGRFSFALALALAALAGYGAAVIHSAMRRRPVAQALIMGALAALLVFDLQFFRPMPMHEATIPQAVYELAQRDDIRAVFNIPWGNPVAAKNALYLQTAHQQALIAGHVTRSTPVSPAKLTILQDTLDYALLDAAAVDVVIVHKAFASADEQALARQRLGTPFYEDDDIALYDVPSPADSPGLLALLPEAQVIEQRADLYLYAPEAGLVTLTGMLTGTGQHITLQFDGVTIHDWTIDGTLDFAIPLALQAQAYHTITLQIEPACPANYPPEFRCRVVVLEQPALVDYVPGALAPVTLERGVKLAAADVVPSADTINVRLWWHTDVARSASDIRFVHLLDIDGNLIAQEDRTLGALPAGATRAEIVALPRPDDLPAGEYRVVAGWYEYVSPEQIISFGPPATVATVSLE